MMTKLTTTFAIAMALLIPNPTLANTLPPLEDNKRVMGELVSGEVGYQIHKHCGSLSARKLRALGRLNELADYARSLGYTDADFKALTKNGPARDMRDARVNAYLAQNGVVAGDGESYCRLGREEMKKKSLTGWLLREN